MKENAMESNDDGDKSRKKENGKTIMTTMRRRKQYKLKEKREEIVK